MGLSVACSSFQCRIGAGRASGHRNGGCKRPYASLQGHVTSYNCETSSSLDELTGVHRPLASNGCYGYLCPGSRSPELRYFLRRRSAVFQHPWAITRIRQHCIAYTMAGQTPSLTLLACPVGQDGPRDISKRSLMHTSCYLDSMCARRQGMKVRGCRNRWRDGTAGSGPSANQQASNRIHRGHETHPVQTRHASTRRVQALGQFMRVHDALAT